MSRYGKKWWIIFIAFLVPYLWYQQVFVLGRFFPSAKGDVGYHSYFNLGFHHKLPDYLFETKAYLDDKRENSKVFLFPPGRANVYEWGYGGTSDITLLLLNRGILFRQWGEGFAPPNGIDNLYNIAARALMDENALLSKNILSLLSARYVLQRNDFTYDFYREDFISNETFRSFLVRSGLTLLKSFGKWDLYELKAGCQPLVYAARGLYVTDPSQFARILSSPDYDPESVFFNSDYDRTIVGEIPDQIIRPEVEFKKISASKYRIRLHHVRAKFPLILGQAFHPGWQLYAINGSPNSAASLKELQPSYRILDNNQDDQASPAELSAYVEKGVVTSLGDGREKTRIKKRWQDWHEVPVGKESYSVDFVSRQNYGSIQNNNLPDGPFYETWFLHRVFAPAHVTANSYANAWIVDPEFLPCGKNADGSREVELVAEFSMLPIFYLGCAISLASVIGAVLWFVWL
jgi:hypothetical protein